MKLKDTITSNSIPFIPEGMAEYNFRMAIRDAASRMSFREMVQVMERELGDDLARDLVEHLKTEAAING